ncbi:MAG: hypothetical protein E6I91_17090 [Chloroflexi bacterium]|nr:MAG: hypothetical protein E6I91_17090 [Chloroflexota bacterium]
MGQYQQWMHYREVDKQLQSQLETLERELAQLQGWAQSEVQPDQQSQDIVSPETWSPEMPAFKSTLLTENKIIRTLADTFNGQSPAPSSPNAPGETISSALFAWSNLPNFDAPEMPMEPQVNSPQQLNPDLEYAGARIPHQEMALLPDDMNSFIKEHTLTDPQIELPWWLRNIAVTSGTSHSDGPIDHESIRTNRLVQRWLERWGQQPSPQNSRGENNHE